MKTLMIAGAMLAVLSPGTHAFAHEMHHTYSLHQSNSSQAQAKKQKVYYGVGFGQHHRTTATGGNAGGYSDRN